MPPPVGVQVVRGLQMHRMHGIDAFSIYSATPTSPFETMKVAIYRPVADADAVEFEELARFVKNEIAELGDVAGMRIVRVPYDLHHPVWVADHRYTPDDHVHRAALPAPGGKTELCEFLSDLLSQPLDPSRPLWEAWVIEALEGGRVAVALKCHHALGEGKTFARLIEQSHSPTPSPASSNGVSPSTVVPDSPIEAEAPPGTMRLISAAVVDLAKSVVDELPSFYREVKRFRREQATNRGLADDGDRPAAQERPGRAPFTVFNQTGGGRHRIYRYETFSLADFKAVARSFDCTINTLVLGVCSEALKRYLVDLDEPPASSLLVAMPVGQTHELGRETRLHHRPPRNSVAAPVLSLHQDIADFPERLRRIKRSSDVAIRRVEESWGKRFDNVLEFLPGAAVRGMNTLQRIQQKARHAYANVIVSNVPGPRERLYALDGRLEMVELLSTGNLTDFGNLNITVWSYADHLAFSFYIRKGVLPEPEEIPRRLRDVIDELCADLHREASVTRAG